jgi:hypothetical protein
MFCHILSCVVFQSSGLGWSSRSWNEINGYVTKIGETCSKWWDKLVPNSETLLEKAFLMSDQEMSGWV